MTRTKPQFRSIFDTPKDDISHMIDAVDTAADAANIGTLVHPSSPTPQPAMATPAQSESKVTPLPTPRARKVNPAPTQGKTMELPVYLWDDLLLTAAKTKTTQRYVVLKAFKDAGYTVHDIDLFKDGRRGRE